MPSYRFRHPGLICALSLLVLSQSAEAGVAWRGRPAPECQHFLITESGVYAGYEVSLKGDLGFMTNVNPETALGGSLHGMAGGDIETNWINVGLSARYRHWLRENISLDVSPRLQWTKRDDLEEWTGSNFGITVAIARSDLIGLALAMDRYEFRETTLTLGVRLGGYLGAPGVLLGLLAGFGELAD